MGWLDHATKYFADIADPGGIGIRKKVNDRLLGDNSMSDSERAAQREHDKDRQTMLAVNRINDIFGSDSRREQIAQYQNAVKGKQVGSLNREMGKNARDLKFAMARTGLTGGSADVDLNDNLNDDYSRGLLHAISAAQRAGASLRGADEASRARLIGQAEQSNNLLSSSDNALTALRGNLDQAQGALAPAAFDSFFSDLADFYKASQVAKQRRAAERAMLGTLFNNVGTAKDTGY